MAGLPAWQRLTLERIARCPCCGAWTVTSRGVTEKRPMTEEAQGLGALCHHLAPRSAQEEMSA